MRGGRRSAISVASMAGRDGVRGDQELRLDLCSFGRLGFVTINTIWGVMGPDPEYVGTSLTPLGGDGFTVRVSRRQLLQRSAVALGGIAGLGLLDPSSVLGSVAAAPRPIPGGFDLNFNPVPSDPFVHVLVPSVGFEMSTITDFNGVIGASETQGTAQSSDGSQYSFDCDMRFMRGAYVGLDGRTHNGSFGFI
jgi:hypothetical protein